MFEMNPFYWYFLALTLALTSLIIFLFSSILFQQLKKLPRIPANSLMLKAAKIFSITAYLLVFAALTIRLIAPVA